MGNKLEERVEKLEKIVSQILGKKALKIKVGIGDTFELNGLTWKVIDITDKGYLCLAERLKESMQFDKSCNDWRELTLRHYLNTEFYKELAKERIHKD